jgi:hypothetical protein
VRVTSEGSFKKHQEYLNKSHYASKGEANSAISLVTIETKEMNGMGIRASV